MVRKNGIENICLAIIIIGFLVSSATVFIVPFASFKEEGLKLTLAYVIGGAFWLGLIISIIFMIILNSIRISDEKTYEKKRINSSVGIFKFFSNKVAKFFDSILIISLICEIFEFIFKNSNQLIAIITLFLLAFSFEMHCVFNGKNYIYIKKYKNIELQGGKKSECV